MFNFSELGGAAIGGVRLFGVLADNSAAVEGGGGVMLNKLLGDIKLIMEGD